MKPEDILGRGYFPKELPPPFTTTSFAVAIASGSITPPVGAPPTSPVRHNLARVGSLRRGLGIPNPINQHELASFVCTHWAALQSAAALTSFPMSRPKAIPGKTRAIESEHPLSEWPLARAHSRAGKRFLLCADISLFYASIYTHSVPWALHTKAVAKAHKTTSTLIGNKLDQLLRNTNDQQTIGLPIGPDISFLIAEIILASVDRIVGSTRLAAGTRYLDDYEFSFATLSDVSGHVKVRKSGLRSSGS